MTLCCRCNGSGKCQNCICVKNGRSCINCLPKRKDWCRNLSNPKVNSLDKIQIQSSTDAERSNLSVTNSCPSINPSCNSSTDKLSQFNSLPTLPQFNSVASPNFTWGDKDSASFCSALKDVYVEVVHWRKKYH